MLNKLWSVFLSLIAGFVILAHDTYKQTARKVRYWMEARNGE